MIKHGLGLLLALTLCGCASERMMKSSPFGANDAPSVKIGLAKDSINGWPLVYKSGDQLSVLWPMYDQNPEGFSVRPLFVKDKDFYGIVPPVCGCENGKGWFLSLYNTENNFGFAPVFNYGKNFSYYGPVWFWDKQYGLFPVAALGGEYQAICPVVWGPDVVFFPGGYFSSKFNLLTLAWWKYQDGALNQWGFFPLVHWTPKLKIALNYWQTEDSLGVYPLFMTGKDINYVTLAWWGADECGFFPLFWKGKDYHALQPLYYYSDNGSRKVLNLCWVLYHGKFDRKADGKPERSSQMFGLVCDYSQNDIDNKLEFGLWPLFNYSDRTGNGLLYLLDITKDRTGVLIPFGFEDKNVYDAKALPRDWDRKNPVDDDFGQCPKARVARRDTNLFLLLYRQNESTYREWDPAGQPEKLQQFLADLDRVTEIPYQNFSADELTPKQRDEVLKQTQKREQQLTSLKVVSKEIGLPENTPFATWDNRLEVKKQLIAFTVDKEYRSIFTPLGWSQRYGSDEKTAVLWPLYRYSKDATASDESIFFRFYRNQHDKNTSQLNIFPFISVFENKDEYQFSWGWRLFRYERNLDQTKYWLFFIPLQ